MEVKEPGSWVTVLVIVTVRTVTGNGHPGNDHPGKLQVGTGFEVGAGGVGRSADRLTLTIL